MNANSVPLAAQRTEAMVKVAIAESEYDARPEPVRDPAAGGNEDGDGQEIGRYADVEVDRSDPERISHLRQRRRDHGAVELLHEQCPGDQERNDRALPGRKFHEKTVVRARWEPSS